MRLRRLFFPLIAWVMMSALPAIAQDDATDSTSGESEATSTAPAAETKKEEKPPPRLMHLGSTHSNRGPIRIVNPGEFGYPPSEMSTAAYTSDKGPIAIQNPGDVVFPPQQDPFSILSDATNFIRKTIAEPLNFSFVPQMIYIYQHATKSNGNHGFSYIYANINGAFPFKDDDQEHAHILYNVQGNSGLGTPTYPFPEVALGSPFYTNNVLTRSRMSLKKLWWRQTFFEDSLTVNIGKLYYQNFFDLNAAAQNPANQFVAGQLTNNTTAPFPSYGFGFIGEYEYSEEFFVRFGTMNALASGVSSGFENIDQGKFFNIVQAQWSPVFTDEEQLYKGNYRVFGWYSNNDVDYERGGWGVGISFDQEVGGGFVPFVRWGAAQDGVSPATMCWSTGAVLNGFLGRKYDGIGLACTFSDLADSGLPNGESWETMVELFWRIQVSRTMQFGPDLQWFNSGQAGGVKDSWIWGLRCTWNF